MRGRQREGASAMEGAQHEERRTLQGAWASLSRIAPHPAGSTASVAAHARRRCRIGGEADAFLLWAAVSRGRISSEGEALVRNGSRRPQSEADRSADGTVRTNAPPAIFTPFSVNRPIVRLPGRRFSSRTHSGNRWLLPRNGPTAQGSEARSIWPDNVRQGTRSASCAGGRRRR